ncbi:hypothetical protein GCM10027440_50840 [Nocardiopsis coralliicola]
MWTLKAAMGHAVVVAVLAAAVWGAGAIDAGWMPAWVTGRGWAAPVLYGVYAVADTAVMPRFRYRVHRWEVSGDVVYTRSGWLNRRWQLVPIDRVQTVDHTQGWMERLFRVATLEIQTASHAGSSTIEGLDAEQARTLSEEVAVRAGELRNDAT